MIFIRKKIKDLTSPFINEKEFYNIGIILEKN